MSVKNKKRRYKSKSFGLVVIEVSMVFLITFLASLLLVSDDIEFRDYVNPINILGNIITTLAVYEGEFLEILSGDPPTQGTPLLNSTSGNNLAADNLTVYNVSTSDPDGDSVKNIINWYRNSSSLTFLNMPFEGGSNSSWTNDYSGYENEGIVSSATWNATGGYDGWGAYEFDGNNDCIDMGDDSSHDTDELTIAAWAYRESDTAWMRVVSKSYYHQTPTEGSFQFIFDADNNASRLWFNSTNESILEPYGGSTSYSAFSTSVNSWPADEWVHLAYTYNGSDMTLYINGEVDVSYDRLYGNISTSDFPLTIGCSGNNTDYQLYFEGKLDDVYVFYEGLSADQIKVLYQNRTDLIVSQETVLDETWYANMTPNDGSQDGIAKSSNTITIGVADVTPAVPEFSDYAIALLLLTVVGGFFAMRRKGI
jgi:hypothetical protein